MIQLFINGKLCDVDDDVKIRLEKNFDNETEHVIEETEYSFEIDLPVTDRNRECFGYTDVFDVGAKFNQNYDAVLNVDETNILKGKFVMDSIDNETYSGNLYVPARKSLKDVLGDKKMKDIKPHYINMASWESMKDIQWNSITGSMEHVVFPYVLYRLPYNDSQSQLPITTQDLSASGNTFNTENIFPAYSVLSVLKDVFEGEGFNIQGNIFEMSKFKDLYQTFSYDPKKYHDEKEVPYYFEVDMYYTLRKGDNTSSTAREATMFIDPEMRWGTDALLLSENTEIRYEDDAFNMMTSGKENKNARVITIPKSGWWNIMFFGNLMFPNSTGSWSQDGRITVCGRANDSDIVDFRYNVIEVQLKKTNTPMSNPTLYSFNMATPIVPTEIEKDKCKDITTMGSLIPSGIIAAVELSYDDKRNTFPKNNATALVKDMSGTIDTSDFICGLRFGSQFSSTNYDGDHLDDRRSNEMMMTCLPDPGKATMQRFSVTGEGYDGYKERMFMPLYQITGYRKDNSDDYRYDYGSNTAQALVRGDSYSNCEGYNLFKPNQEGSGGTWDTRSNFGRKIYPGQNWSYAQSPSYGSDGNQYAGGNVFTCVWLDEGDNISVELMMPFNDNADDCGWLEFCDWKHFYKAGTVNTYIHSTLEMAFVSTDPKYVPTNNNPLPDLLNVDDWNEFVEKRNTNVNKFLGDTKVNDWINNLLTTFNLRLTKVNDNTYSIDTMITESNMYGSTIDIDEWVNVKDAEFKRLDVKNTKLEWTISTDEEGYVHGNNTREVKTKRDESGYTGSALFEVPSSNSEQKIKSNYSYTWEKDISFVNGSLNYESGVHEVPVIGDAEMWENNFTTIQEQDYATDKTPRLIYLDRNPDTGLVNYFWVNRYKDDTTIPENKMPMLFCKNYITYESELGVRKTFRLDYDNSESTKYDETITDVFFNIKKGTQYEVDLPVTLPNDIYAKIKANTLVKFNDCLFRVLGIEGHDVNMGDSATLKLITLN